MHNDETFGNLEASLEALKRIINEQRAQIQAVEHERDLLAVGYRAATEKCEELAAFLNAANDSNAPVRATP